MVPPLSGSFDSGCLSSVPQEHQASWYRARDTKPDTGLKGVQLCEEPRSTNIPQLPISPLGFTSFSSNKEGPSRRVPRSSQSNRYQDDFRRPKALGLELDWLEQSCLPGTLVCCIGSLQKDRWGDDRALSRDSAENRENKKRRPQKSVHPLTQEKD